MQREVVREDVRELIIPVLNGNSSLSDVNILLLIISGLIFNSTKVVATQFFVCRQLINYI